jgi:hypothetical protein
VTERITPSILIYKRISSPGLIFRRDVAQKYLSTTALHSVISAEQGAHKLFVDIKVVVMTNSLNNKPLFHP